MTLAEAREDLLAQARLDLDLYKGLDVDSEGNAVVEAEGLTDLISRACVWWAKLTYCNYEPSVSMVLTVSTSEYDGRDRTIFGARILKPRVVVVNDAPLYRADGRDHGLWTMGELQHYFPTWRLAGTDTPTVAIWLPSNTLKLWATPDAAYTGKNFVEAWTIPDELTIATDENSELPVPEEDHMSVLRLAMAFGAMPGASEPAAWQRIAGHDAWWRDQAERRKRENLATFLGRKPRGAAADWLYR